MYSLGNIPRDVTDERFRTAVVLGIASLPFTVVVNWILTPDPLSATSLFIVCVMSGYLYRPRSESSTRAGTLTGFIGGIPLFVWESWTTLINWWGNPILTDTVGNSVMMAAVSVGAALITGLILTIILRVVGLLGGTVGRWMNEHIEPVRLPGSKT